MTTVTTEGIQAANKRLKEIIREATMRLDQAQYLSVNAALLIRYGCWVGAIACGISAALAGAVVAIILLPVAGGMFLGGQRLVRTARDKEKVRIEQKTIQGDARALLRGELRDIYDEYVKRKSAGMAAGEFSSDQIQYHLHSSATE